MDDIYEVPQVFFTFEKNRGFTARNRCKFCRGGWDMKLPHAVQGPPGLEPLYQVNVREETHGKSVLWQRFSTIICFVHRLPEALQITAGHLLRRALCK